MPVEQLEVLVEEPSMAAAMEVLVPKILGSSTGFSVHPSQCKSRLLANLPALLTAYRHWLPASWRLIVIVDCDDAPCMELKDRLEETARDAGLASRTAAPAGSWQVANRNAVDELAAWFFGDMDAVRAAYPRVSSTIERQGRYRDPDAIKGGTWEALERVLQRAGYFRTGLRKIEAARAIAPHMNPTRNRSHSFQVFRDALLEIAQP